MAETRAVPQCDEAAPSREEPVSWRDEVSVRQATIVLIVTRRAQRTPGIWRLHGRRGCRRCCSSRRTRRGRHTQHCRLALCAQALREGVIAPRQLTTPKRVYL